MSLDLIWYIIIFLFTIGYIIIPNIIVGYQNVVLSFRYFSFFIFFSPSAYLFYSSIIASVWLPISLILFIPNFFSKDSENKFYNKRYLIAVLIILAIIISFFIIQVIIWGSSPYGVDNQGYIHLRMIPFYPWPNIHYPMVL